MPKIEDNVKEILRFLGFDPECEGLLETPKRHISYLKEFLNPPQFKFTTFKSEGDGMIIVKDIPFYSLCEHHLLPFFGIAHIAYIPGRKIVGLSKIPRVLESYARRLQNQERITKQVAQHLNDALLPKGVAVVLNARHMCMEMRGVEKPGSNTITSSMLGVFLEDVNCRQEFLNLIK